MQKEGQGRFRLDPTVPPLPAAKVATDYLAGRYTQFPSKPGAEPIRYGSYQYDKGSGKYNKEWSNVGELEAWLAEVQREECVEFCHIQCREGVAGLYLERHYFVCARRGTGGPSKYTNKHPDWARKVPSKITHCGATLTVKIYADSEAGTVLGIYDGEHNHATGIANLCFTRIPFAVRDEIAGLLRQDIRPEKILERFQLAAMEPNRVPHREDFMTLGDILRIQKGILAEATCYDSRDGKSVLHWVERLRKEDSLLAFKSAVCPAPPGSNLCADSFVLAIQTPMQRSIYRQLGKNLLCIDGTHNTTMYENTILTTLLVRDEWGHGIPVAWMLASSGTEEAHGYFLSLVLAANPGISPTWIMTDRDLAQINACEMFLPLATILLCWWHVLHNWQQRFVISQNEELWDLLKVWIRLTDAKAFEEMWVKIRAIAPDDFTLYLETYWMPERFLRMWSAQYRKGRTILEVSDTNMLVEAWHHVLKGKFLEGKRNRRMDHLLFILVTAVTRYYEFKRRRQQAGFEGCNLEVLKRFDVVMKSKGIAFNDVEVVDEEEERFAVKSQTDPSRSYIVDLPSYSCNCPDFPLISYCKHICAVQTHYPETFKPSQFVDTLENSLAHLEPRVSQQQAEVEGSHSPQEAAEVPGDNCNSLVPCLERLVARIRITSDYTPNPILVASVTQELKRLQEVTDLLPSALIIAPNQHSWSETQAVMMPARKKGKKRAGDAAYGGGEQSGKKAKKTTKKVSKDPKATATTPLSQAQPISTAPTPPAEPMPLPHTQPTTATEYAAYSAPPNPAAQGQGNFQTPHPWGYVVPPGPPMLIPAAFTSPWTNQVPPTSYFTPPYPQPLAGPSYHPTHAYRQ